MSLPALQPELRALELFDVIPAGHFGLLIRDASFAPHLRPGEIAVVDTTDKERAIGELYCLTIGSGERQRLAIVESTGASGQAAKRAATCAEVADWPEVSPPAFDIKGVPAWRREAWHRQLIKKVDRALASRQSGM